MVNKDSALLLANLSSALNAAVLDTSIEVIEDVGELILLLKTNIPSQLNSPLARLLQFAATLEIKVDYKIYNGYGVLKVTENRGFTVDEVWSADESFTPAPVDVEAIRSVDELKFSLESDIADFQIKKFLDQLEALSKRGVNIALELRVSLDKTQAVSELGLPGDVLVCLFIFEHEAVRFLTQTSIDKLIKFFGALDSRAYWFLVGAEGYRHLSDRTIVLSLSQLTVLEHFKLSQQLSAARDMREFREENSIQGIDMQFLHAPLFFSKISLVPSENIFLALLDLGNRFSLAQIADEARFENNQFTAIFHSPNRVEINLSSFYPFSTASLVPLLDWICEDLSRAKLQIVREIVGFQASAIPGDKLVSLSDKSTFILEASKANFALYVKNHVGDYFARRLEMFSLLRDLLITLGSEVTRISSELIENFYKVAGVALALFVAYFVKPDLNFTALKLGVLVLFCYLALVLIFMMPAYYIRYDQMLSTYEKAKVTFRELYTAVTPSDLGNDLYQKVKWHFRFYFLGSHFLYAALLYLLYLVFRTLS